MSPENGPQTSFVSSNELFTCLYLVTIIMRYMQTRIVTENYVAYMWFLTIYITLDFHKVWNTPEDL